MTKYYQKIETYNKIQIDDKIKNIDMTKYYTK